MKALQNLIPNSNKVHFILFLSFFTPEFELDLSNDCFDDYFSSFLLIFTFSGQTDKASMLDEAIEYLKQLQLQVQVSFLFQSMLFWVYVHVLEANQTCSSS